MRVKIHPSFFLYLLCIAFISSLYDCLSLLIAFLIHELSHCIAAKLTGEQLSTFEITPCGGVLTYKPGTIPSKGMKGILVHSAGPVGNWLVLLTSGIPVFSQMLPPEFMRSLLLANISLMLLNLLPVFPLDGGHIVFCLGYYFFPVADLIRCLSVLGMAVGLLGIAISVYGFICHQILNSSLLIVSSYLLIGEGRRRRVFLCENVYAVIHERITQLHRIRRKVIYQVSSDVLLLDLLDLLKQNITVSFVFSDHAYEFELTEEVFCKALLSMHNPTVREAYFHLTRSKENAFSLENTCFPS